MGLASARWLGPAGKGVLSTLLFAATLAFQSATLGLGDAAMVMSGRQGLSPKSVARASFIPVGLAATVLACCFVFFWIIQFPIQWDRYGSAVIGAALLIPVGTGIYFSIALLNAKERFGLTSMVNAGVAGSTFAIFTLLSVWDEASVLTAILSAVVSSTFGFAFLLIAVLRSEIGASDGSFLRTGLRLGLPVQVSHLLVALSQRLDQVLVFSFAGPLAGGQYSVALTLGQLVVYAPFALSSASFPRIAQLDDKEVPDFIARLFRASTVSLIVATPVLALAIVSVTPVLFGPAYRAAIAPSLILMMGGWLWISQWLLARALAARGRSGPLLQSFAASLVVMIILNRALVPTSGLKGAAVASTLGAALGFGFALGSTIRTFRGRLGLKNLIPQVSDFRAILELPTRMRIG